MCVCESVYSLYSLCNFNVSQFIYNVLSLVSFKNSKIKRKISIFDIESHRITKSATEKEQCGTTTILTVRVQIHEWSIGAHGLSLYIAPNTASAAVVQHHHTHTRMQNTSMWSASESQRWCSLPKLECVNHITRKILDANETKWNTKNKGTGVNECY